MTHDPMCPQPRPFALMGGVIIPPVLDGVCELCDLISRVREDERLTMEAPQLYYAKGYAAALSDAVDAVAAVEHWASYNTTDDATYHTFASDPVAAIEALKEKP